MVGLTSYKEVFVALFIACHFRTVTSDDVLDKVCGGAKYAAEKLCSLRADIPTSASVQFRKACTDNCCAWDCGQTKCTNNCCSWDCGQKTCTNRCCSWSTKKCKWGVCVNIPEFGCSKARCGEACINIPCTGCSKQKCGETCVNIPCTGCSKKHCGESCINVPDTLKIKYESLTPCSLLPAGAELVEKVVQACPCLRSIKDAVEEIGNGQELTADALAAAADLSACLLRSGFDIQNTKEETIADLRSESDFIILGPSIDMSFYQEMLGAVTACVFGGCQPLVELLMKYFKQLIEAMGEGFVKFLKHLLVDTIASPLKMAINDLGMEIKSLPGKLKARVKHCTQSVSSAPDTVVESFSSAISVVRRFPRDFKDLVQDLESVIEKASKAADKILALIDLDEGPKAVSAILEQGNVPLVESVQHLTELDEIKETIGGVVKLKTTISEIKQKVDTVQDQVQAIEEIRNGVLKSCAMEEFAHFESIEKRTSNLHTVFGNILDLVSSIEFGPNMIQAGIATYSQFADLSLDLPCTRERTMTFADLGLTAVSASYPEIYSCPWTKRIPFPNEHITYVRIKMNKNIM